MSGTKELEFMQMALTNMHNAMMLMQQDIQALKKIAMTPTLSADEFQRRYELETVLTSDAFSLLVEGHNVYSPATTEDHIACTILHVNGHAATEIPIDALPELTVQIRRIFGRIIEMHLRCFDLFNYPTDMHGAIGYYVDTALWVKIDSTGTIVSAYGKSRINEDGQPTDWSRQDSYAEYLVNKSGMEYTSTRNYRNQENESEI